jgi:DNA helicase IV
MSNILSAIAQFFTGRDDDAIRLQGDRVHFTEAGKQGGISVQEIKNVTVEQSFLGLFGSSISIKSSSGTSHLIKGLRHDEAVSLKNDIDEERKRIATRIAIANAKDTLQRNNSRIVAAYQRLTVDDYFSSNWMTQWLDEYGDLIFLKQMSEQTLRSTDSTAAVVCRQAMENPERFRSVWNDQWIQKEINRIGNDRILGPLTSRQKEAIIRNDNRVLTVAGAGTGKTSTVIGKVKYLLDRKWCKPEEILLLSFSKDAVMELEKRLKENGNDAVNTMTFHKLGLEIIKDATGEKAAIFDTNNLPSSISRYLTEMFQNPESQGVLVKFLAYHFYPDKTELDFKTKQAHLEYATGCDLRTLRDEKVKSNQEVQIANWLYLNGVNYRYEDAYTGSATGNKEYRVYKPDFYLPNYNIYIEHFGVNKNGDTAPWVPKDQYLSDMKWKKDLHAENMTTLVETYSFEFMDGSVFNTLEKNLSKLGVTFNPPSHEQLAGNKAIKERLKSTARLASTFMNLFKSGAHEIQVLQNALPKIPLIKKRERTFLAMFQDILARYQQDLSLKREIDFGDMIIHASKHVESGRFKSPYKVIIVDEFQDIAQGRAWLMNSLLEQVPDSRLLCVGDDWQSIYRFTGSDIGLMTNYKNQWKQAVRIDLDKTFRFNSKILDFSTTFITSNPNQLMKSIIPASTRTTPAIHITSQSAGEILGHIKATNPSATVLVLGRYGFTTPQCHDDDDVQAMTVHKSKGLEADYVVVNDVVAGKYGFPSEMQDDPIISMLLTDAQEFAHAEERRLFYVAVTRAKKDVWLQFNSQNPSCFILEVLQDKKYDGLVSYSETGIETSYPCPECGSAMTPRKGKTAFLGCIHWPRCSGTRPGCPACGKGFPIKTGNHYKCSIPECSFTAQACPNCTDGMLVQMNGRYGQFMGCSNFQACGKRAGKKSSI